MIYTYIKKRVNLWFSITIGILLLLMVFPFPIKADGPTLVTVNPLSKIVSAGQTFTINISCTPGQPIKAYELKVLFNPSLLQANSVSEGTIFSGYSTFFNDGTINNIAGTIIDVYGLILGPGLVSNPGNFVSISFTARLASGVSTLSLSNVGVANATMYVPITVTNGTVILREFTLGIDLDGSGSVTKNPNQATYPYGTAVQLTATANTGWMFSSWTGSVSGSTNPVSIIMNGNKSVTAHFTQNQYALTITINGSGSVTKNPNKSLYTYGEIVSLTAVASSGWVFNSWAGNITGSQNPTTITMNGNKGVTAYFIDSSPPQISGITYITSNPLDTDPVYGWVNVSCTVTDNTAVSLVVLRIHNPGGSWNNITMTTRTAMNYYYRSTTAFSTAGNYTYTIWAKDINNNENISTNIAFSMPANWDLNSDGHCTIFDLVLASNHYGEIGINGWIREDVDNNGQIQIIDFVKISNYYGESWWN